jgi:pyridoxine kinase
MFSDEQANLVANYCKEQGHQGTIVFVDPILGDGGRLYNGMTNRQVELMREMVAVAHLTFPNYTEACYLTNTPIKMEGITWDEAQELLKKLCQIGCKSALITSCKIDGQNAVAGYNHVDGNYFHLEYHEIPGLFHGTGDIFSAVLIGHLLNGETLKSSTRAAMDTVFRMIERYKDTDDKNRGIPVEKCLDLL